ILPGTRVEQILRVRMKGDMPIEIALLTGAAGEVIDERFSREGLPFIAAGVADVPVMLQGEVNAGVVGIFAHSFVGDANRLEIILRELLHADAPHVAPEPVRIHLVADDVVPDASMRAVGPAVALREEFHAGAVVAAAFFGGGIEGAEPVRSGGVILRVEHDGIELLLPALVIKKDEADDDFSAAELLHARIEPLEEAAGEVIGMAAG